MPNGNLVTERSLVEGLKLYGNQGELLTPENDGPVYRRTPLFVAILCRISICTRGLPEIGQPLEYDQA